MTQHPGSIGDVLQPKHHDSSKASTAGHQVTTSGQVFWLPDQSTHRAFPSTILSGICGFCPRLQRRDRDGFTPSSLFSRTDNKSHEHPSRRASYRSRKRIQPYTASGRDMHGRTKTLGVAIKSLRMEGSGQTVPHLDSTGWRGAPASGKPPFQVIPFPGLLQSQCAHATQTLARPASRIRYLMPLSLRFYEHHVWNHTKEHWIREDW